MCVATAALPDRAERGLRRDAALDSSAFGLIDFSVRLIRD